MKIYIIVVLLILCSCSSNDDTNTILPPSLSSTMVSGKVLDTDGKPIPNVVVSDGVQCFSTNDNGEFAFETSPQRRPFVYISTPAEYELPEKDGIAFFYQPLKTDSVNENINFILKRRNKKITDFVYITISDPQLKNEGDLNRFTTETLVDLAKTVQEFCDKPIIGVTLGDHVYDQMELFDSYKTAVSNRGLIMFSVIGNHDYNKNYVSLERVVDKKNGYAQQNFNQTFGPTAYSFNIGNVHVVTLEDIDYRGNREYDKKITSSQLNWLKEDLQFVPKSKIIFLNLHAATSITTAGKVSNSNELYELLDGYNVHIFSGHSHAYENVCVNEKIFEHNIGAACGAFWKGNVNKCGAPNGYLVTNVDKNDVSWYYKSTGKDKGYQFRVYKPGEFKSQSKYLVVNVWDYDPSWKVECLDNGDKMSMERFEDEDQEFINQNKGSKGYYTNHLFRVSPDTKKETIEINVTNRFGDVFVKSISLP